MIPKIIHYCWFGRGKMSPLMKKCVKSWRKYCPDYKIIEWNEDSFDIESVLFTKQAYEAKKYAFVSDYVRLAVLYKFGGVYFDTDVEIVKNIDMFLSEEGFIGVAGLNGLSTGLIGAKPEHSFIFEWLKYYNGRSFLTPKGEDLLPNTEYSTALLVNNGLILNDTKQTVMDMTIYSRTYFCPTYVDTAENFKSENTYAIHYFTASWRTPEARRKFRKAKFRSTRFFKTLVKVRYFPNKAARKILGDNKYDKIKNKIRK